MSADDGADGKDGLSPEAGAGEWEDAGASRRISRSMGWGLRYLAEVHSVYVRHWLTSCILV